MDAKLAYLYRVKKYPPWLQGHHHVVTRAYADGSAVRIVATVLRAKTQGLTLDDLMEIWPYHRSTLVDVLRALVCEGKLARANEPGRNGRLRGRWYLPKYAPKAKPKPKPKPKLKSRAKK